MRKTEDRLYGMKIATRFASAVTIRNKQNEDAISMAEEYLAMSYNPSDEKLVQAHPMYALLRALTIGYLHSAGEENDRKYEEYAKLSDVSRHMSSTYRPDLDPHFLPMIESAFDMKVFDGANRYALKTDLTNVYVDFTEALTELQRAKLESDAGLFGTALYDGI